MKNTTGETIKSELPLPRKKTKKEGERGYASVEPGRPPHGEGSRVVSSPVHVLFQLY